MSMARMGRFFGALSIGLAIGCVVLVVILALIASAPASDVRLAPDYVRTVKRGGMVAVEFTGQREAECITQTTRWLWRDIDGRREIVELQYSAMAFGHDDPDQRRRYRFMFEVPRAMESGEWNVRTLHADYCWPWSYVTGPRLRTSPPFGLTVE